MKKHAYPILCVMFLAKILFFVLGISGQGYLAMVFGFPSASVLLAIGLGDEKDFLFYFASAVFKIEFFVLIAVLLCMLLGIKFTKMRHAFAGFLSLVVLLDFLLPLVFSPFEAKILCGLIGGATLSVCIWATFVTVKKRN